MRSFKFYFSVSILLIFFLYACEQTRNITYSPTRAVVTVHDDNGNKLSGALVRLFDNKDAYLANKVDGIETGFISSLLTDEDGSVTFSDLNTDKEYYFLVTYRDRSRFLDLDNADQQFKLTESFGKGTESHVTINLLPAKSVVSFYTSTAADKHLPIKVFIGSDSVGNITQASTGVPTSVSDIGPLDFRLSQGLQRWYAKSALGCLWTGEIKVNGTESFNAISLTECNAGSILFYVGEDNKDNLPIKITLNKNDQVGTLSSFSLAAPTQCFQAGFLSAARGAGTYTYTAESVKNGCVWSGSVIITEGSCDIIKLPSCQ